MGNTKILVVQAAALGHDFLLRNNEGDQIQGLRFRPIESVFPAVTCTVQASFRTGELPERHGMVGNGFYSRELARTFFWEQSSSLVSGPRIWDEFRQSGHTVGQLFWQQSLGPDCDLLLSPAPIHKHHGGMIQDCFSRPDELYRQITDAAGGPFDLRNYWGPKASVKATSWIAAATDEVMKTSAPDLLLTYLPHLDYELQRSGPDSPQSTRAFVELKQHLEKLLNSAGECGYKTLVFGDYAIRPVTRPVFPNRILREKGFLALRRIKRMTYPDFHTSRALAVADHQTAHVIVSDPADTEEVKSVLEGVSGVAEVIGPEGKRRMGLDHPRAGELVLIAEPDSWFAYPWWEDQREAPDYAAHVDIHNKPGYDPCELFAGGWPFSTSTDAGKVRGSHGLVGAQSRATWASDIDLDAEPETLIDLSRALKTILQRNTRS